VLPEAERMAAEAVNALLKTLEEPPERVVLILTTGDPDLLLPTVVSRCQLIPMRPLAVEEIRAALLERWGADDTEATALAGLAGGRLGWAVEAHRRPELRERRDALLTRIVALADAPAHERMRLAGALASDTEAARSAVECWALWWHDALLASMGSDRLTTAGAARTAAERLGRALRPERAEAFLRRLVETHQQLDQNANPRLALEVLALDYPEADSGARPPRAPDRTPTRR
jgi:DNA polymerase-3 subunit delta'